MSRADVGGQIVCSFRSASKSLSSPPSTCLLSGGLREALPLRRRSLRCRDAFIARAILGPLLGPNHLRSTEPDLELLVATDLSIGSGGKSTRAGLSSNGGAIVTRASSRPLTTYPTAAARRPPPRRRRSSSTIPSIRLRHRQRPRRRLPLQSRAGRRAYARLGILPDAEGFDQADFWQRLADHLGVDARSIELTVSPAVDASRIIGVAARIALPADRALAGAMIRLLSRPTPEISRALAVTLVHPPSSRRRRHLRRRPP